MPSTSVTTTQTVWTGRTNRSSYVVSNFPVAILTGPFLPCFRHSCLLCQLCLEHCFETVRMRLKVTQSIVDMVL